MSGAGLARLILRRGTTAALLAAVDGEALNPMVVPGRSKAGAPGVAGAAVTDGRAARRGIPECGRGEPVGWSDPPPATASARGWALLLGVLGGGLGGFVFAIVGAAGVLPHTLYGAAASFGALFQLPPLGGLCGAVLGGVVALAVTGAIPRAGLGARVPLAAGLAASFLLEAGVFLWLLAGAGQFNHILPRSAESLVARYRTGKRDFVRWNLRGADLRGAELHFASLEEADLSGADLRGTDLRGARLERADLRGADLREGHLGQAYLRFASLRDADLGGADLSGADLGESHLGGANLAGANLYDADLRGADLRGADLSGTNLSRARLVGARVTGEQLAQAASLRGAILPDGTVHR
jgi:uncharacterized protein YjbI with pentapeptide repeats